MDDDQHTASNLSALLRHSKRKCEDRKGVSNMEYTAANGRRFSVTKEKTGEFYAYEVLPSRKVRDRTGVVSEWPKYEDMLANLNGMQAGLDREGLTLLFWTGGGYRPETLFHVTLEGAAAYILRSLADNELCDGIDHEARENKRLFEEEQLGIEGVYEGLYTETGPILDTVRDRIAEFLRHPTVDTWSKIAGAHIHGTTTLYEMWDDVPSDFIVWPQDGRWTVHPKPDEVRNWLRELSEAGPARTSSGVGAKLQ